MKSAEPGLVLVDAGGTTSCEQGHIPGALHLPHQEIAHRAAELLPTGKSVVTYCWGPGCNGATRAALAFVKAGYEAPEMIGGYE